jgi:threonine/homoserine/homoserine lactone efflux protein
MDPQLVIAGMSIGLAMSAPLGPVNLIVIRTALNCGFRAAFLAGLGAVLADMSMAGIAAFGLHSIAQFITAYETPLQIIGGLLLVILGIKTARTHFAAADLAPVVHAARFGLTYTLSVTNPGLVLGFLSIFSSMSGILAFGASPYRPMQVLLGVAMGGALWWLVLSFVVSRAKSKLSATTLDRINRWSGIFVAAFGFALLLQVFD